MNRILFTDVDLHNTTLYFVVLPKTQAIELAIEIFTVAYGLRTPSSHH
jgi:hypothetical protein